MAGDIVTSVYCFDYKVLGGMCAVNIHQTVAEYVCQAGSAVNGLVQSTSLQRNAGGTHKVCLVTSAIYILVNGAALYEYV